MMVQGRRISESTSAPNLANFTGDVALAELKQMRLVDEGEKERGRAKLEISLPA